MTIRAKDFQTIVSDQSTVIQASQPSLLDFTPGSMLLALTQAVASVVLWIQGICLTLLARTRASTSVDADLDSWMADFGLTRLAAVPASGLVTFRRYSTTGAALVTVGTIVQSSDGAVKFTVIADTLNAHWSSGLGGYTMADTVASVIVPVVALTAGVAGNVVVGGINTMASAAPGIDTATNAAAFVNGADAEKDPAFRLRFVSFLASLARGTKTAIIYAVQAIQQGASCSIVENQQLDGTPKPGYFYVTVDDGSGAPSSGFIAAATAAVESMRANSITYGVFAPSALNVTIALTTTVAADYVAGTVHSLVASAISTYVASIALGGTLEYSRLYFVAYEASAGVVNVTGLTVNGGTADVVATPQQKIVATSVTVS